MRSDFRTMAVLLLAAGTFSQARSGRTVIPLDGTWQVAESLDTEPVPTAYPRKAPVPGLANLATPPFPDVDKFDSRELIDVEIRDKTRPEDQRTQAVGVPRQNRNYFWYRRTFKLPAARRQTAVLRINKTQFGAAVWINNRYVGRHYGCFSAALFEVTRQVLWGAENTLVVRIGAHPAVLPRSVPAGTDKEKLKWTPGIYDSVSLALADSPLIETVQVAPRLASSEILSETVIWNPGAVPVTAKLRQSVHGWQDTATVASAEAAEVKLAPGERAAVRTTLRIPDARLWTPETPNLYVLESSTGGDSDATRFGMREFRFDTPTRRAYLNGRLIFLRGSNIALHRFFEDPECKDRPWNEAWVRKLLGEIPKKMNWNSFRFTLGPAPQFWYDIADEAGLLIQNEFPIWGGHFDEWSRQELVLEFGEWMRDHWNHPSVAVWDASNETAGDYLRDQVIPLARGRDLSNRPWDNGWALPEGPDDMVEDHPYLFIQWQRPTWKRPGRDLFQIPDLESMVGAKTDWNSPHPTAHAFVINEYGWLWLNRDGSPTRLTDKVYERLVGAKASAEERFEAYAYYLAGLTELWRAHREAAGVQHFVYLTCSYPGVKTSDNFRDIATLELEPHFADYVREAFKPLGVYINFWQPEVNAAERRAYAVMMINDDAEPREGVLQLSFEREGKTAVQTETPFRLAGHGQQTYTLRLAGPEQPGFYVLKAAAKPPGGEPTVSRRKVEVR
jgi:beta-galactosidase